MNIIESINYYTKCNPSKDIMFFINEEKEISERYTYIQFKLITDKLAKTLIENLNVKKVMLVYPPGLDFMVSFIACLKANIIPIPVYPPNPYNLKKDLLLFHNIVKQSNITTVLTNSKYHWASSIASINFFKIKWPNLNWIVTDKLKLTTSKINLPTIDFNQIAFIQYTSGSCSLPKPIYVKHKNLTDNMNTIKIALNNNSDSIDVSWLPQYHDMGLIGSRLCCIANGGTGIYISPITFIMDPIYFIQLCSTYKCTHIQGPNFMYKLIARKWNQDNDPNKDKNLDLSSVYHIFNAAENISYDDYMYFYLTFKKYGLKKSSLATGYGLAESVVYVSDSGHDNVRGGSVLSVIKTNTGFKLSRAKESKEIMGCGWTPDNDCSIITVKDNSIVNELEEGEIYVSSKSITDECLTEKINNKLYLKTGDLGFIYNNELFVTGRCKDLIIINGKNFYPNDFEWVVDNNSKIKGGTTAVFEDENKIILITEPREQNNNNIYYQNLAKELNKDIIEMFGFKINIIFLKSKSVIKTTSGKISRSKCKENYKLMNILYKSIK